MPDDTTIVQRTKDFAKTTKGKRIAVGAGGGLSLVLAVQLFVTQAEFSAYKTDAKEKAAEMWRSQKDLENKLDAARLDIVRLQTKVKTTKTNTP